MELPKGSILGSLLFQIFINDLPGCSNLESFLFADDTAVAASSDNFAYLYTLFNAEFQKLCIYLKGQ